MKKKILVFIALLNLNFLYAEKIGDTINVGKDVYMLVREIKGAEANAIFQQNVAVMRSYAEALKNAREQLEDEKLAPADVASLKMKIKEIEDMYISNNNAMVKTYNFAVERQYMQDYDDVFVSTKLSDSEVEVLEFEDGAIIDIDKIAQVDENKVYRQKRIQGKAEVAKFQRELFSFLNAQVELKNNQELILKTEDVLEKNEISAKISALNNALQATQNHLFEVYEMIPNRDYLVELNSSKLYLLLNEKEIAAKKK